MKHIYLLSIFILAAGCSGNMPVSGKVTFSDDGSPVPVGMVVFDDGINMARAPIQPDGTFVMGFNKDGDGVPPGTYGVTIVGTVKLLDNPDDVYPPPSEELVDLKYSDKATSGLSITVDGSKKTFDIKVERPKKVPNGK
jgi:hypothetical protein